MHCRPEARTFRLLASRHGCRCNRLLYCDIFATCNSSRIRTVHRLGVLHTVRECCIPSVSAQLLLYFFTYLLFSTVSSFIHYAFIHFHTCGLRSWIENGSTMCTRARSMHMTSVLLLLRPMRVTWSARSRDQRAYLIRMVELVNDDAGRRDDSNVYRPSQCYCPSHSYCPSHFYRPVPHFRSQ